MGNSETVNKTEHVSYLLLSKFRANTLVTLIFALKLLLKSQDTFTAKHLEHIFTLVYQGKQKHLFLKKRP